MKSISSAPVSRIRISFLEGDTGGGVFPLRLISYREFINIMIKIRTIHIKQSPKSNIGIIYGGRHCEIRVPEIVIRDDPFVDVVHGVYQRPMDKYRSSVLLPKAVAVSLTCKKVCRRSKHDTEKDRP